MPASKVYFTDFRATQDENLPAKFRRLLISAGILTMPLEGKYVAIKIHFGEPGNLSFLRPAYARALVDLLREAGAKPFLTDSNTLYVGGRQNALDHIDTAYENGFSPLQVHCPVLIADGLLGTDDVEVPIAGELLHAAKIGRAVMDADIVISLSHFKGHEATGFGGALKNLGMGCGSRRGKMEMHTDGKPRFHEDRCVGCGRCALQCAHGAISFHERETVAAASERKPRGKRFARVDRNRCVGCGRCVGACHYDAIGAPDVSSELLGKKIAEYTLAVVQGRPHFHISLACDISPYCDCHPENDAPILPDVGMFASFDPVAIDMACADALNRAEVQPGSALAEQPQTTGDHFTDMFPTTTWRAGPEHAQKIGVGTMTYDLVRI